MKVSTLTLNPAIDQTILCSPFALNTVNRGQSLHLEAGGKGVNVATFLAESGCPAIAAGFLGRDNAAIFEDWFASRGIEDRFVRIAGHTRLGIKIVDRDSQQTTDINLPGLRPDQDAVDTLLAGLPALAAESDTCVLTGSLPPGLPVDFYAGLIRLLRGQGCPVVLDSSGPALRAGLAAGPAVLKPNLAELEELVGSRFASGDLGGIVAAARALFCPGVELVVVSLGGAGALFVQPDQALHAAPPAVTVCSTVGAGDALVAGLISARLAGLDLAGCARRAVAFSLAAVTAERRGLPSWPEIQRFESQVGIS